MFKCVFLFLSPQLASTLAELVAAGLPLDAAALCGGVVAEAAELGLLRLDVSAGGVRSVNYYYQLALWCYVWTS